jgi:hypothetical protein
MKMPASLDGLNRYWNQLNSRKKWLIRITLIGVLYLVPCIIIAAEYLVFRNLQISTFAPSIDQTNLQIQRIYLNAVWVLGIASLIIWIGFKIVGFRGKILMMPWIFMIFLLFLLFTQLMNWFNWG